jgi:hypothetical protein
MASSLDRSRIGCTGERVQVPVSRSYEVNVESFDFTMGGSN